jgi:hypothetical protein
MFGGGFGCAPAFPWAFWSKPAKKVGRSGGIQTMALDGNSTHAKWKLCRRLYLAFLDFNLQYIIFTVFGVV